MCILFRTMVSWVRDDHENMTCGNAVCIRANKIDGIQFGASRNQRNDCRRRFGRCRTSPCNAQHQTGSGRSKRD